MVRNGTNINTNICCAAVSGNGLGTITHSINIPSSPGIGKALLGGICIVGRVGIGEGVSAVAQAAVGKPVSMAVGVAVAKAAVGTSVSLTVQIPQVEVKRDKRLLIIDNWIYFLNARFRAVEKDMVKQLSWR